MYGQNNCFHSNTGAINLSNCHGKTEVKVKSGDLKIGKLHVVYDLEVLKKVPYKNILFFFSLILDSLEGDLNCNMEDGNTDVYVTKPDSVSIATERGECVQ